MESNHQNQENPNEDQQSALEIRKKIESLIRQIPPNVDQESYRIAASIATGAANGRTLKEIAKYYSLPMSAAQTWWEYFNFGTDTSKERNRRGAKTASIESFVKSNIGKTFKSSEIVDICNITNPTLYNFINANRGWFKKTGRGEYLIVDQNEERMKDKSAKV